MTEQQSALWTIDAALCRPPLCSPQSPPQFPQLPRIILDRKREHVGLDVLLDIHDLCPGLGVQIVYGAVE